jgi:hypothetical protein
VTLDGRLAPPQTKRTRHQQTVRDVVIADKYGPSALCRRRHPGPYLVQCAALSMPALRNPNMRLRCALARPLKWLSLTQGPGAWGVIVMQRLAAILTVYGPTPRRTSWPF